MFCFGLLARDRKLQEFPCGPPTILSYFTGQRANRVCISSQSAAPQSTAKSTRHNYARRGQGN